MNVAVIDLGKTNSKVAVVDTVLAQEVEVVTQEATVNTETPYPSLDHVSIESFIVDALRKLASTHSVDAITVTTHGATVALIDRSGQLAMPVLDYEFRGIDSLRDAYERHRPPFAETGSPPLPGGLNAGAQLYWLQATHADLFATAHTMLTWPQYWVYQLTGKRHNDVTSLGCHTDLYEPARRRYSSLVSDRQWHHLMPPTHHSGQLSGTLLPSVAKRTGLPPSLPVYTGIHDSNASLVPHLTIHSSPFTVISTGTWFIAMAIGGHQKTLDESKDTLLNVNAYGQPVPSARFMGGREREMLGVTEVVNEQTMTTFLGNSQAPPLLMPSMAPGTGPFPSLTAQWVNSTDSDPLQQCAITFYLALMTHECMQLIGSDGDTFIEGPLAHDYYFAQMLTCVTERPVWISESQTGTSVGAAMLINTPQQLPPYKPVSLDTKYKSQLQHYATLWQQQLSVHAR